MGANRRTTWRPFKRYPKNRQNPKREKNRKKFLSLKVKHPNPTRNHRKHQLKRNGESLSKRRSEIIPASRSRSCRSKTARTMKTIMTSKSSTKKESLSGGNL